MHEPVVVRGGQGRAHAAKHHHGLVAAERRAGGEPLAQRVPFEPFHHQKRPPVRIHAEVVDSDHVGVREAGRGLCLLAKPGVEIQRPGHVVANQFHGDRPLQHLIGGGVDGAHPAATQPAFEAITLIEQPRTAGVVSGSPSSVHTSVPSSKHRPHRSHSARACTIPRRSFDQEPDRRGDGDEQIEVLRVVGLFGPPRPEHQQRERHGAGLRRGDRDEQLDAVLDEQQALVAGELVPHPCGVAERERERLAQHGQHANDRQRRRQGPDSVPSQPCRHGCEGQVTRHVPQDVHELRVQRLVYLLGHRRRNRVEARGVADLIRDAAEQPVGIVAFPEEPAIDASEPFLAPGPHQPERCPDQREPPPSRSHQVGDRLVPVHEDVEEQDAGKRRDHCVDEAAGQRVAQALPHDQADVEQTVTQDGVGEGRRHCQEAQRQHRKMRVAKISPQGSHQ